MAVNQHLVEQAKILYMQYQEPAAIAKKLDIAIGNVHNWVHRGTGYDKTPWKELRLNQTKELLGEVKETNRVRIANIFKMGLPLIERALKERTETDEPLSIMEAKQVTDILMSFDKIERLEENKPTEIVDNQKNVSLEELRRVVLSDPFVDIELVKGKDYGTGSEHTNADGGIPEADSDAGRCIEDKRDPLESSGS